MKRFLLTAALVGTLSVAHAAEVSVPLDDQSQKVVFQLPALLDACVAGLMLRNEPSSCKAVSGALSALGSMVSTAQKKAEADAKQAAEKAAADKAVPPPN